MQIPPHRDYWPSEDWREALPQEMGMNAAFFASGFGGKLIYVIPGIDLVIVTAASPEQARQHPEQWKEIMALIPGYVLPAVTSEGV